MTIRSIVECGRRTLMGHRNFKQWPTVNGNDALDAGVKPALLPRNLFLLIGSVTEVKSWGGKAT
jgi:hypothetical protein